MPVGSTTVRVAALLLLVGATVTGAWVVLSGDPPAQDCRSPEPDIGLAVGQDVPANRSVANVTVERVDEEAIRLTYHDLAGAPADYGLTVPPWLRDIGVRVNSAAGFAVYRSANGTTLVLKEGASSAEVTVTTEPTTGEGTVDSAGAAIASDWALLPIPPHTAPTNLSLAPRQEGVVGDQLVLLGDHRTVRRQVGCQTILVHAPTAVASAPEPERIADRLATASEEVDVGWRYETVRAVGVGDPARPGGRTLTHEFWVHTGRERGLPREEEVGFPPRPVSADSWLHQYFHTRQGWRPNGTVSTNTSWLTEAVPSYYEVGEAVRQDRLPPCNATAHWHRLNASLHAGPGTMNLTAPRTYRHRAGAYTRGSYVLGALDYRIRSRTAGSQSLTSVWKRLNDNRNLTAAAFESAVVATAGPGIEPWLDRYVEGTAVPPPPPVPLECAGDDQDLGPVQFWVLVVLGGFIAVLLGRLLARTVLHR